MEVTFTLRMRNRTYQNNYLALSEGSIFLQGLVEYEVVSIYASSGSIYLMLRFQLEFVVPRLPIYFLRGQVMWYEIHYLHTPQLLVARAGKFEFHVNGDILVPAE